MLLDALRGREGRNHLFSAHRDNANGLELATMPPVAVNLERSGSFENVKTKRTIEFLSCTGKSMVKRVLLNM